jgi:NitT/TauT family transport system permease protein
MSAPVTRAPVILAGSFSPFLDRFRRLLVVVAIFVIWELAVRLGQVNTLLFPAFSSVLESLATGLGVGGKPVLWSYIWQTLSVILQSFAISILLAVVLTSLALVSTLAKDFLFVVTGMFQPLPSIALLPMASLWFGFSRESLVFVVVMSMVWPVASSLTVGFATVSRTLVSLGRNYELGAVGTLVQIMLPAALPMLISGLRVGWGFGWRTVVAAELVFGATGSSGGIGWYINNSRLFMNVADGFAGILLVILIGLAMESIFLFIQRKTTLRWGTEAG